MKAYKYGLMVAFVLLFIRCDNKLDLKPFNALSVDEALQSNSDFDNAIRGAYAALREGSYYGGNFEAYPDFMADNVIICSEGRQSEKNLHYWEFSGNSTYSSLWTTAYYVINRANLILENVGRLKDADFKNNITGEALALRALAHFDLARVFAKPLKFAQPTDLGVPYVISSDAGLKPSRNTVQETYQKITDDLEQALTIIKADNGVGRLKKASVQGLLSRLYLYTENWQKVIDNATLAIASSGTTLASTSEFPLIWKDQTEKEVLFKVRINDIDVDADGDNKPAIGNLYSQTGSTGVKSEYVADYAFYQLFPSNDVRRFAWFSTSVYAGKTFNHIAKYFGRNGGNANTVDSKALRLGEIYLNRAEAYSELNQDANALADLNALRTNRYTTYTPGTEVGAALKSAIALERRKELAYEGHRFFDIKRKGLPIQRSTFGDESNGGGLALPANVLVLPPQNFKFQLPIPQSEVNANPKMVQNPNY